MKGPYSVGKCARSYLVLILVATVTVLGAAGIWYRTSVSPASLGANDRVLIAAAGSIGFCPLVMAQRNGYLANEGVTADFRFVDEGKIALEQVFEGQADLAIVGEIPIMYAAMDKKPVSILATMTTMADQVILGRQDRGISKPTDLKGKRIGYSAGNTTQFFLDEFLIRQRLSRTDYIGIDMKPAELLEAIVRGDVDAIATYQPRASLAATAIGSNAIIFSVDTVYDTAVSLVATRAYARSRLIILQKLLRAAIRGAQFCRESPDDAMQAIAPISKVNPTLFKDFWPLYRFELTLRQSLLLTLEDEGRWAIRNGSTGATALPNFLDHFEIAPLNSVSPLAVTIIH
jgi:NitT/TauT family transport system substrate-binding protein